MPTTFSVDHERKTILTTASGILSLEEALDHLKAKAAAGAVTYAELFDARDVSLDFSVQDLMRIAAGVREVLGTAKPGPVAVVTNNNFIYGLARTYQVMTAQDNPRFEVFRDYEAARASLPAPCREPACE